MFDHLKFPSKNLENLCHCAYRMLNLFSLGAINDLNFIFQKLFIHSPKIFFNKLNKDTNNKIVGLVCLSTFTFNLSEGHNKRAYY